MGLKVTESVDVSACRLPTVRGPLRATQYSSSQTGKSFYFRKHHIHRLIPGFFSLVLVTMKKAMTVMALLLVNPCEGFSTSIQQQHRVPMVISLPAHKSNEVPQSTGIAKAAAALMFGAACVVGPMAVMAETALDFSLPSYDTNMQGFGDGKEAILNTKGRADRTDPGANEREKQVDSMRKAEEARLEAKAKKKAEMKALEEEANRRAAERKARDAERLKNIWN